MRAKPSRTVHATVEAVRMQIRSGSFRSGALLPAEIDLASELGVSRGTIRRAIDVLVESGELTRRRHSRPVIADAQARPSVVKGNDVMVWISRPIADDPALRFLKGISRGLAGTQFRMVVREPSRFVGAVVQADERHFLKELLNNDEVAGAMIERDPFARNEDLIQELVERGRNLVFVDTPPPDGIPADHVGTANVTASRACVEHMLDLGHSRIVFAADSDFPPTTRDRIKGYWRAMKQAGVERLGRSLIATDLPREEDSEKALGGEYARAIKKDAYFSDLAYRIAKEFMSMEPRPTALFAAFDVLALWLCAFLEGMGLRVPGDVSVAGFDWLAGWDKGIPDTLTTAAQDFEAFGRHAANLLLDRIAGDLPSAPRYVLLDAPLVVRSSTASDLLLPGSNPAHGTRAMQPID
jgi:LacI family transcriptional regulator